MTDAAPGQPEPPDAPGATSAPRRAPATSWRTAVVRQVQHPSEHAVSVRLDLPGRRAHRPGQHYVLRLTAPDGYRAQRSYSVASAPHEELLELYVERLPDGEVSGFLADELAVGDELEVRGPIGEWFAWDGQPALGVGGGSGVVPLVAMLRHAARLGRPDVLRLAVAARTRAGLPYADELEAAGALVALSREAVGDRPAGRLQPEELGGLLGPGRTAFVCGSAAFAEASSRQLVALGVPAADVRVERFGATG